MSLAAMAMTVATVIVSPLQMTTAVAALPAAEAGELRLGEDTPATRAWVGAATSRTLRRLRAQPVYEGILADARRVLTRPDSIGELSVQDGWVFEYGQSAKRPMGVWRRSPLAAYEAGRPVWTSLIDLDALSRREGRRLFLAGASCRADRCLVGLSENGRDARETREYDLRRREFVVDGFRIPASKSRAWWFSSDQVLVAPALETGDLTVHGLPSRVLLWGRGQPLSNARPLFAIGARDASLGTMLIGAAGSQAFVAVRQPDFATRVYERVGLDGSRRSLPLPSRASVMGAHQGMLLIRLDHDWRPGSERFRAGTLVGVPLQPLLQEGSVAGTVLIYTPSDGESVTGANGGDEGLLVSSLRNYASRLQELRFSKRGWQVREVPLTRPFVELIARTGRKLLLRTQGPLEPDAVISMDLDTGAVATLAQAPAAFDASNLITRLLRAQSADGTTVDYLVMHRRDMPEDGSHPTLVYGYGGFDVPVTPRYEPLFGKLWLERGGVYVHAYLRGGGERGPAFRSATMREGHERAFEDLEAVLRDLQARRITSPERTGVIGRSNGGLLTAAVMERAPSLMNAAVIGGPLIDMLNYHRIAPGGTWISEYGDPDDARDRAVLQRYSPMQNVAPSSTRYPVPLIITSRDDDRVLPVHARSFAALLTARGHDNMYFEDNQGGHYWELAGGPAAGDWRLRATARAVEFTYLWTRLGGRIHAR